MIYRKSIQVLVLLCIIVLSACGNDYKALEKTIAHEEQGVEEPQQAVSDAVEITIEPVDENQSYVIKTNIKTEEAWLSEENNAILLRHNNSTGVIKLDLSSLSAVAAPDNMTVKASLISNAQDTIGMAKGELIKVIEGDAFAIYHRINNSDKLIGKLSSKYSSVIAISPDRTKVAFISNDTLVTYNIISEKTVKMQESNLEGLKLDKAEKLLFSPLAGYLTIKLENENGIIGFKSYGADSGKLLHDTIYGIAPVWSHGDHYIAFLYRNSKEPEKRLVLDGVEEVISDKIALFNRKTKKITYFTEFKEPTKIIGAPIWAQEDTGIIFTTGIDKLLDIHLYQLKNRNIVSLSEEEGLKLGNYSGISDIQVIDNNVIYVLNRDAENKELKLVDLSGKGAIVIDGITPVGYQKQDSFEETIYKIIKGRIVYKKGNSLYKIEGFDSKAIIKSKHPLLKLQYLEKSKMLAAYALKDGELEIQLVNIQ